MRYAILCCDSETAVASWTKAEDDALMAGLAAVERKLAAEGKLGPNVRLMPTTTATTLRKDSESLVTDGPFAETKERGDADLCLCCRPQPEDCRRAGMDHSQPD